LHEFISHFVDFFASGFIFFVEFSISIEIFGNGFSALEFGTNFSSSIEVCSVNLGPGSNVVSLMTI
jgi:hypothetical protein